MSEQVISSIEVLLESIKEAIEQDHSPERKITKSLAIALIKALSGFVKDGKPLQVTLSEGINSALEDLQPSKPNLGLSSQDYQVALSLVEGLSKSFIAYIQLPETNVVQLLPSSEAKQVN